MDMHKVQPQMKLSNGSTNADVGVAVWIISWECGVIC